MPSLVDRTGQRFGLLVVQGVAGRDRHGHVTWMCLCDCGTQVEVRSGNLQTGNSRSCGSRKHWVRRPEKASRPKPRGKDSPYFKAEVGYSAAHIRVRAEKGSASRHACTDCGNPAAHWSYNHRDPEERVDARSAMSYSLNLDYYEPRCPRCHKAYDREHHQ